MSPIIGVVFDGSDPLPGQKLMPTGHDPLMISTPDELERFIAGLIDDYGSHSAYAYPIDPTNLTRSEHPERSIKFAVHASGNVGGLVYYDSQNIYYGRGAVSTVEVAYQFFGNTHEWPADSVIPLRQVKDAVNSFREQHGVRPDTITWAPWPAELPV